MPSETPGDEGAAPGSEPAPGACARCGTTAPDPLPLTWSYGVEGAGASRREVRHCPQCSRENVRAIEGRLDETWW